jgi:hypothetical protein
MPKPVGKLQHKNRKELNLQSLARSHTEMALRTICGICLNGKTQAARVAAAALILERGWGRAPQAHTGEDGEGDIRVTIRHIIEDARGMVVEGKAEQLKLVNPQPAADLASDGAATDG